jgi:GDPmannose 4,6-dehydratase
MNSEKKIKKTALICGVNGQDGAYLAKLLIEKGYKVCGTSRDAEGSDAINLKRLGIYNKLEYLSMLPDDFRSVLSVVKLIEPDEVYHLAGQSSVALSYEQPAETIQSTVIGTLNMLEVCRMEDRKIRFYQAGSSECFGDTGEEPADERKRFQPKSPYAVAKSSAFWLVDNYREAYGIYACTGILFNHESILRPERFVTKKIIEAARRISNGQQDKLELGRIDIARDWGWAPEYVEAMWMMLQQKTPEDFVIATGETYSLEDFVRETFAYFNLDWEKYVFQDKRNFRPTDIKISSGNPAKANSVLNWKAKIKMPEVVQLMCQ